MSAIPETAGLPVPEHIAIIMDGNGRWAAQRGLPRSKGHEEGAASVQAAVEVCHDLGVKYLTLYAFSVENWRRPKAEVRGLMRLLSRFLRDRVKELHKNGIRLRVMGRMEDLPAKLREQLTDAMHQTAAYTNGQLILALSYGGRTEISLAARRIAEKVLCGALKTEDISESTVAENLYLPDVPDPDLLIRTSGEMRLSNFLLWQSAYAEMVVTPVCWPDFREAQLRAAVSEYRGRDRRFGQVNSGIRRGEEAP